VWGTAARLRTLQFSSGERTRLACWRWALAIANFSFPEYCGEAPQWAREARALPGFFRRAE